MFKKLSFALTLFSLTALLPIQAMEMAENNEQLDLFEVLPEFVWFEISKYLPATNQWLIHVLAQKTKLPKEACKKIARAFLTRRLWVYRPRLIDGVYIGAWSKMHTHESSGINSEFNSEYNETLHEPFEGSRIFFPADARDITDLKQSLNFKNNTNTIGTFLNSMVMDIMNKNHSVVSSNDIQALESVQLPEAIKQLAIKALNFVGNFEDMIVHLVGIDHYFLCDDHWDHIHDLWARFLNSGKISNALPGLTIKELMLLKYLLTKYAKECPSLLLQAMFLSEVPPQAMERFKELRDTLVAINSQLPNLLADVNNQIEQRQNK